MKQLLERRFIHCVIVFPFTLHFFPFFSIIWETSERDVNRLQWLMIMRHKKQATCKNEHNYEACLYL